MNIADLQSAFEKKGYLFRYFPQMAEAAAYLDKAIDAKRLGYKTPCAVNGDRCYDCSSPDRICNAMVLHLHKLGRCEVEVVLIGQELGF